MASETLQIPPENNFNQYTETMIVCGVGTKFSGNYNILISSSNDYVL